MSYALLDQYPPIIAPARRAAPKRRQAAKPSAKPQKGKTGKTADRGFLKTQMENLVEIFLVTAFCFSVFQGYLFLTQSPHLQVANVTIIGNQTLPQEKLLSLTGPIKGMNIFALDLPDIAEKLNRHPWIRNVSIDRQLPSSIYLHVEERTPYARIQFDDIYLMDNYAVLMEQDSPEYRHLPLITGVRGKDMKPGQNVAEEGLLAGLKVMHYLNRLEFFRNDPIDTLHLNKTSPSVLTTRNRGIRIFIDLDAMDESFENFKIILDLIDPEKETFEYIDLSFKDKVVVKPGGNKKTRSDENKSS